MFNYFELTIALFMSALATFILTFFVKEFAVKFKFIDIHDFLKINITTTPRLVRLAIYIFMSALATFILTFFVKEFAVKFKFIDIPDFRKIHITPTPRLGGLAIYFGFLIGLLYLEPHAKHLPAIIIGSGIIVLTGALDDRYGIRAVIKLSGQISGAAVLVFSGLVIERVTLPFFGMIDLGVFGIILTLLWIVGITNAINLIDGLDGLATGVSTIALSSMFVMAIMQGQVVAAYLS